MAVDKEAGIGQLTGMVVQKLRGAAGALRNPVPALGKAKSLFSGTAPAVPAVTEAAGAVKPMTFRNSRSHSPKLNLFLLGQRQKVNAILRNHQKLREIDGVGTFSQYLTLRASLPT